MSLTLHINEHAWQGHQDRIAATVPGLVPVAKGNGYGFGLARLAAEAARLAAPALAVGTAAEVAAVRGSFSGDVVVLQPWRPGDATFPSAEPAEASTGPGGDGGVIWTVSRPADLAQLAATGTRPRVILELLTSMRRFGMTAAEADAAASLLDGVRLDGWSVHLPMARGSGSNGEEAVKLGLLAQTIAPGPVWFSHLTPAEYADVTARVGAQTRLRMGTALWLGAVSGRRTTATVLDVHRVARGDRIGYWQRPMPADGHVIVVSGGTANGIALEAPTAAATLRQRAIAVVTGSLEAAGFARSPYTISGAKRWFVEPPHMQASMVFAPAKVTPPAIGDEVPVELRLTTGAVDTIDWE